MPELPEVETLARQLRKVITGKQIRSVEVLRVKSFHGNPKNLVGKQIITIDRMGKMMIINFQTPFPKLLIHLKMTGQIIYQIANSKDQKLDKKVNDISNRVVGGHPTADWVSQLPSKHTRAIITFTDNSILYFNDQRVFGWLKLVTSEQELEKEKQGFNGLDPILPSFTGNVLQQTIGRMRRPVKIAILEQTKIAGLGNIYANDALYLSHIHPLTLASNIPPDKWDTLAKAITKVLLRGIEVGGSSQKDYVHIDGMGGTYQDEFLVYKQDKKACPRCGTEIEKIKVGGRGTYYCPGCQE